MTLRFETEGRKVQKQWLTPSELACEYSIGKDCQAKYRMARKIPFHKFGGFIRYSRREINEWIESHKVKMTIEE